MKKKQTKTRYEWHYSYDDRERKWKPTSMKQKALWVFILIFWLVGTCTFFAMKTQEQMTPQVTSVKAETSYSAGSPAKLPLDCLQVDEYGMHLYMIYEGTGWEAGTRVQEVQGFSMDENNVLLDNGGWGEYVQYASKALTEGELVDVIRGDNKVPDQWLAVFPEKAPELGDLDSGYEVVAWVENAVLLSVESDTQPFMEGRAKSNIPVLAEARVYSLNDMKQFLDNFVCSGLLLAILIIVLSLWGYAWYENQHDKKYPRLWPLSLGIGLVFMGCIAVILHFVNLPSSLLPPDHITDLGYFFHEFDQFFEALDRFAGQHETVDNLLKAKTIARFGNLGIMALGGVIAALIVRGEDFLMEELFVRRMRRQGRVNIILTQ